MKHAPDSSTAFSGCAATSAAVSGDQEPPARRWQQAHRLLSVSVVSTPEPTSAGAALLCTLAVAPDCFGSGNKPLHNVVGAHYAGCQIAQGTFTGEIERPWRYRGRNACAARLIQRFGSALNLNMPQSTLSRCCASIQSSIQSLAEHRDQHGNALFEIAEANVLVRAVLIIVDVHRRHACCRDVQGVDKGRDRD